MSRGSGIRVVGRSSSRDKREALPTQAERPSALETVLKALAIVGVIVGAANFFLQAVSIWITHPIMLASMAYLLIRFIFPALTRQASKATLAKSVEAVRGSGAPLARVCCTVGVGGVNHTGILNRATVYEGGIVIKVGFLTPFAVAASEIVAIRPKRVWGVKTIEVEHKSAIIASPLRFHCSERHPFVVALRTIAPAHS